MSGSISATISGYLLRGAMPALREGVRHMGTSPPELLTAALQRRAIPSLPAMFGSAAGAAVEYQYNQHIGKPAQAAMANFLSHNFIPAMNRAGSGQPSSRSQFTAMPSS